MVHKSGQSSMRCSLRGGLYGGVARLTPKHQLCHLLANSPVFPNPETYYPNILQYANF